MKSDARIDVGDRHLVIARDAGEPAQITLGDRSLDSALKIEHSDRMSSDLQLQPHGRMAGFVVLFFGLGFLSVALVGLGLVGATWSGITSEVVALWTIGGVLVLLSATGCEVGRAGARPWKLLAAWALLFTTLAILLAILE
jgi:hypothetical protein